METSALKFPHVEAVLQEYAKEVREAYKDNLVKSDRLASEDLYNSIETTVERDGRAYLVTMTLAEYWKYVEGDTAPHWPPVDDILRWIRVKPVLPRPDSRGKLPTEKQLAFLIGRKIARSGTIGSHDLRDALRGVNGSFEERIAQALREDIAALSAGYITQLTYR